MNEENKQLQAVESPQTEPSASRSEHHSHHSHHHRRRSLRHQMKRILFGRSHYPDRHDVIEGADARKAILFVALATLLLLTAVFFISRWENQQYSVAAAVSAAVQNSQPEAPALEVNGVSYLPKTNIESYLFMGIDVNGVAKPIDGYLGGGQADVQMLLVLDHEAQTWQLLQINRDTMTDVPVLGPDGSVQRTEFQQITLAHAYGNGYKQSCVNVVNTVSALLGGQTINGYYSMNMDGIAIVNDAVGGVPVTITSDFSLVDDSLPMGETVTLTGQQAETFVRARRNVDDQTNISRMARQRVYLASFFEQLKKQDDNTILKAYDEVFPYTVTDIGSQTVTEMIGYLRSYEQLPMLTIDGEAKIENDHWAYYLDETSLQNTILQLFYQSQEE